MGDRAAFVDDSNETRLSGELVYPGATVDDVLTVQADGSIAAALGGGSLPSGDGPPSADPETLDPGALYVDATNGALYIVYAFDSGGGPVNSWAQVGGETVGTYSAEGVITGNGTIVMGKSLTGIQATLTDLDAANNSGNGLQWYGTTGVDGGQELRVRVGAVGTPQLVVIGVQGVVVGNGLDLDMSGGGDSYFTNPAKSVFLKNVDVSNLPTANPGAGLLWNDSGVLSIGT